jgi:hypothetical protein
MVFAPVTRRGGPVEETHVMTNLRQIEESILANGRVEGHELEALRRELYADGKIDDQERKFLHRLKGEARQVSPEFEALFAECMKQPFEQHTSG